MTDPHEIIEEAMTERQTCSACGSEAEIGFGLAGGGYGAYAYCPKCEVILEKWQEEVE